MKLANKIVITLSGAGNTGKTTTLKRVIDKLERKYKVNDAREKPSLANDKLVIVDIDGVKVGISTGGDNETVVKDCITKLFNKGCNIIVTATRSRGRTLDFVEEFCENNNYKKNKIKKSLATKQEMNTEEHNNKCNEADSKKVLDAIFHHLG